MIDYRWLFDGVGGTIVVGALGALVRQGWVRWRERRDAIMTSVEGGQPHYVAVSRKPPLLGRLPAFLLRTLITPEQVRSKILLGLREKYAVHFYLNEDRPQVHLYFQVSNFGQPTFTSALLPSASHSSRRDN